MAGVGTLRPSGRGGGHRCVNITARLRRLLTRSRPAAPAKEGSELLRLSCREIDTAPLGGLTTSRWSADKSNPVCEITSSDQLRPVRQVKVAKGMKRCTQGRLGEKWNGPFRYPHMSL